MKTNKFLTLILSFVAVFAITSCVEDDDFTIPSSLGNEENAALVKLKETSTEVDMAYVQNLYTSGTAPEQITGNIYVKGYVSSSDVTGNFYKEFYMQNAPSNPTKALKVIVSQSDTYNQFNKGREVYINLNGLYVGEERIGAGVYTIGGDVETDQYGTTVQQLDENQVKTKVLRSGTTADIIPLQKTFSSISAANVGMLVSVDNVEFADDLAGEAYLDPTETYDTQRTMQACEGLSYATFQLETSSFASFKQEPLPVKNGTITAVVAKTFDGSQLVMALNTTADVNFTDARCTLLDISEFSEIFSEDFQDAVDGTDFDLPGWTNFSEAGSRVWREEAYLGNGYAEFGTYNAPDDLNIAWLVSPSVDMDAQTNVFVNFKAAQHHLDSNENTLEVFVSTDFDGTDVLGATWEQLSVNVPTTSNSWYQFVDSGLVDVSQYTGNLYVAFKVTGSGTDLDLDGSYQVDDFKVLAN